jgi:hypothetical protein
MSPWLTSYTTRITNQKDQAIEALFLFNPSFVLLYIENKTNKILYFDTDSLLRLH